MFNKEYYIYNNVLIYNLIYYKSYYILVILYFNNVLVLYTFV